MNKIHTAIIDYIKENKENPLSEMFVSLTDEQLIRSMFSNYRGGRGLRLTNFGLQVMNTYFKGYDISVP